MEIKREHTSPHLYILRIKHQPLHPLIQSRKRINQLLWRSGNIPPVLTELVILGRIETIAANHFTVTTRRHDDFVDSESAPVLDGFVVDVIV